MDKRENVCWLKHVSQFQPQPDQPQPSIPEAHSTPTQFGNSLPKTSPLPEQKKLPNPIPANSTSDENEDELIPCPYDSRISYAQGGNSHRLGYGMCHFLRVLFQLKNKFLGLFYSL